ncbi:hypothetical protein DPMN_027452 [Dreissena polymorpha]|uniref:Uncharacterized protein n=1 Tax=Dreissena polymorpha TaxID=45954 RepID=A0A9D4RDM9_DREPO|nr:hypothetical protein DPMN_027452 [Dreissena polymorpha]
MLIFLDTFINFIKLLTSLNWRRLDLRRIDQRLVMFHNILHNQVAIPIPDYLKPITRPSRTSHTKAFQNIQTTTDCHKFPSFPEQSSTGMLYLPTLLTSLDLSSAWLLAG